MLGWVDGGLGVGGLGLHELAVNEQLADDGMAWLGVLSQGWQMLADGAQAGVVSGGVLQGCNTGLLKVAGAVLFEQVGHAHEAACGLGSALDDRALGPATCVWADGFDLALPVA